MFGQITSSNTVCGSERGGWSDRDRTDYISRGPKARKAGQGCQRTFDRQICTARGHGNADRDGTDATASSMVTLVPRNKY